MGKCFSKNLTNLKIYSSDENSSSNDNSDNENNDKSDAIYQTFNNSKNPSGLDIAIWEQNIPGMPRKSNSFTLKV